MVRKCEIGVRTTRSRSALATAVQAAAPPAKRRILRELAKSAPKSTRTRTKTTSFVVEEEEEEELGDDRTVLAGARTSPCSDDDDDREAQVSCCSSNNYGSSEIADDDDQDQDQFPVDLKDDESSEVETSTRGEMTPSSKLRGESDNRESTSKPTVVNSNRRSSSSSKLAVKMPSESELEDFFASAEKDIQKRFAEKYNFDIVKDTPLQGRYEWVRLNITKNS